jgi:hypothetical protein
MSKAAPLKKKFFFCNCLPISQNFLNKTYLIRIQKSTRRLYWRRTSSSTLIVVITIVSTKKCELIIWNINEIVRVYLKNKIYFKKWRHYILTNHRCDQTVECCFQYTDRTGERAKEVNAKQSINISKCT